MSKRKASDHLLTPPSAIHSGEETSGTPLRKKQRNEDSPLTPTSTPEERPVQRGEPIEVSNETGSMADQDQDQEVGLPREVYQERQVDGYVCVFHDMACNFLGQTLTLANPFVCFHIL